MGFPAGVPLSLLAGCDFPEAPADTALTVAGCRLTDVLTGVALVLVFCSAVASGLLSGLLPVSAALSGLLSDLPPLSAVVAGLLSGLLPLSAVVAGLLLLLLRFSAVLSGFGEPSACLPLFAACLSLLRASLVRLPPCLAPPRRRPPRLPRRDPLP